MSTWTIELLSSELQFLVDADFAIEATGFDAIDLDKLLTPTSAADPDDRPVPPLPTRPVSRTSVAFPAFALGRDPRLKIMSIVASQGLASELCDQLARLMSSDLYRTLFPHAQFDRKRNALLLSHGGSFSSFPFFSSLIGRGADILIVDDPVSPADAKNKEFNRKAADWFISDAMPRLNDNSASIAILVMQRVAGNDLTTAFFAGQPRKALVFSAVARVEERWRMPNGTIFVREPRTVLNPQLENLEQLFATYCTMPYGDFVCQYLQDPNANRWINCNLYYPFDTTDWTPEKGTPKSHCMFSNS